MITTFCIFSFLGMIYFFLFRPFTARTPSPNDDVNRLIKNILEKSHCEHAFIPFPGEQLYVVKFEGHRIGWEVYKNLSLSDIARVRYARKQRIRRFVREEKAEMYRDLTK